MKNLSGFNFFELYPTNQSTFDVNLVVRNQLGQYRM